MENEKFQELVLAQFEKMNSRFDKMDSRFDSLESQVKENTQILKALEHLAQVNKSEHDRMIFDIANIAKVKIVDERIREYFTNKTFRLVEAVGE